MTVNKPNGVYMTTDGSQDGGDKKVDKTLESLKERGFASVEALMADRDKLAEERDALKEHNEKAQKIIQRQGSELGDLRKQVGVSSVGTEAGTNGTKKQTDDETADEIEASLTDEQRDIADKAYQAADDELKARLVSDESERKKLLKIAKETVKSVPKSLFERSSKKKTNSEADDSKLRNLFKNLKGATSFSPGGSSTGASTEAGTTGTTKSQTFNVRTDGVLSAIKLGKKS